MTWKLINNEMPKKGEDIIGLSKDGEEHYCFLCNRSGKDWRCSITGYLMMIEIEKWMPIKATTI